MIHSKLLAILTLIAMVGLAIVTSVSAAGYVQFGISTSVPCACSELPVYTIYVDTQFIPPGGHITSASILIPAGYMINPAYLTTTAGIIVATGNSGNMLPYTSQSGEIKTTTTTGQFEIFVGGSSKGTFTIVPPSETTPGDIGGMLVGAPDNNWAEITFVTGFFINPCTPGTYIWGPNSATYQVDDNPPVTVPVYSRDQLTDQVTLTDCAVGGVALPINTLAILTPYLALAGIAAVISTVVVVKRRKE
jgi:hypothetical protein